MNPKLIVIAGHLQGATFDLNEDEVSIGRDASNSICLVDPSVSRRHFLIKREANQFKLTDLGSFNGTFVNGVPVSEQFLQQGDQLAVGNLLLLFLQHDVDDQKDAASVDFDEGNLVTQSVIRLRSEDALYLNTEMILAALPPAARMARNLQALLKISTTINSINNLNELQNLLLESIFEVVPAERAAILLADEDTEDFVSSVGWNKLTGPDTSLRVSRTVIKQAVDEGAAILCNDVVENALGSTTESLITERVHSLLCVPLRCGAKFLGVIYMDTSDATTTFNEHHLQLMAAIGGIASVALEKIRWAEQLRDENQRLNKEINLKHKMVGESPRIREVYQFIAKVAPTDSTVLIRGESGTGKELAARALHLNSPRDEKPFLAINCATLTETLLESELFGHEKGAFSGAIAQKRGKLEVADGGTVFLDEVGELTPTIQAKFLRVLHERAFVRVGGTRSIKVDIRILAATNKNLEEAVRAGCFRSDLYYRLNVISFTLPPLRERREDIPLLANFFAVECSRKAKRKPMRVSEQARSYLINYDWPGNVRELENAIERAVVFASSDLILPEDLPDIILESNAAKDSPAIKFYDAVRATKKQLILDALTQAQGNFTEAAKLLGVHPNNLHRLVRNLNLRPPSSDK